MNRLLCDVFAQMGREISNSVNKKRLGTYFSKIGQIKTKSGCYSLL